MMDAEKKLWAAVMRQAILDAGGKNLGALGRVEKKFYPTEARRWIESPASHVGSFVWICDLLGLEAGRMRSAIRSSYREAATRVSSQFTPRKTKEATHDS